VAKKMNREQRARLAQETLDILERGRYKVGGMAVEFADDLARAVDGTVDYRPGTTVPAEAVSSGLVTNLEVTDESNLAAARRLARSVDPDDEGADDVAADGDFPVVLNFASARNPGGGFLGGAQAQEESLARSSGLFPCLLAAPDMYDFHDKQQDPMYSDWVIYAPAVPVFRDDGGNLLRRPFRCAIISCPAVNAGVVLDRNRKRRDDVRSAMARRMDRILAVAAAHGHSTVVLGAWGCGVFRNDPDEVAALFAAALQGRWSGRFDHVVFAVQDTKPGQPVLAAFRRHLAR